MTGASRTHCRFVTEKGRTFVEDLGSTHGTYVNGVRRDERAELAAGDCIEIPWGLVLRVGGGTPLVLDERRELVRLIIEAPEEEGRWRVWADALLDAGDPLGERVARGRGADRAEDAKALGQLARGFIEGGLEIDWRHGFIRRAVMRHRTQWPPASWALEWHALLRHPLARFVEELEVDALSYTRGLDRGDNPELSIVGCLGVLAKAPPLPLLRSVRFGPSPRPLWNPQLESAWRLSRETHPRLEVGPIWVARAAWLQLLATPPGVTVTGLEIGAQRKLVEDGANFVSALTDCEFSLEAPDKSPATQVALRLDRENGLWFAEDVQAGIRRQELPLYVNGRRCTHHRMRPHDLLEPAPGLLFRFVME
ncbi:MAG: FHA domain-containing protein [Myxococcaceae bacterium]|nr:FHA domain-containing protein [Myxococcaceae bacterium]